MFRYGRKVWRSEVIRRAAHRAYRHLDVGRYCPCCEAHPRKFEPNGINPRPEARCPACGSLERHRLTYSYIKQKTDLFDGRRKRMLHVAPEEQMARLFRDVNGIDYVSADLSRRTAMLRLDLVAIPCPDCTFDAIYCSHVLEHVPDDRRAMRELHRVLKPGGWAILQVPITGGATFEDPTVTSPEERLRLFGQHDHVRRYGADYASRLAEAGFSVTIDDYALELGAREAVRLGVSRCRGVHFCRKAAKSCPVPSEKGS